MKVTAPSSVSQSRSAKGPAKAAGGFSMSAPAQAQGASQAAPAQTVTGVSSVDALLALQAVGTPGERKRRAVSRAGRILDVLDEIKVALLEGDIPASALDGLLRAVREQRDETDEPGLETVLDEIEVRAAVELAKYESARTAA